MRRRRLKKLLKRLQELQEQTLTRDQLLLKLGAAKIAAAHVKTRQTYGATRLQVELNDEGFAVGRDRVARLRRDMGMRYPEQNGHSRLVN